MSYTALPGPIAARTPELRVITNYPCKQELFARRGLRHGAASSQGGPFGQMQAQPGPGRKAFALTFAGNAVISG
jgi:hypothetical protein